MSEDPAYDPGQTWWDRMWGTIGSWWRSIPAWEKALAGTILVIASIGIAVATGGASIGPEAQLLGGVSALAAAAKVALIEVSIGIGFAVAGWAISSAISGNWSVNALNDAVADAIFFAGVFLFISTSVSALKYAYRGDPYPKPEYISNLNSSQPPQRITGYTQHGLDQAMFRDGHGISPRGILDAVRNPVEIIYDVQRDTFKYIGKHSITVLNPNGMIVTTWSIKSFYWRY